MLAGNIGLAGGHTRIGVGLSFLCSMRFPLFPSPLPQQSVRGSSADQLRKRRSRKLHCGSVEGPEGKGNMPDYIICGKNDPISHGLSSDY